MKKLVIGILAHVDAGKTTLSEGLLYKSGAIRKTGRVDNRDAYLDTYGLEKKRGITIFSKQAQLAFGDMQITLLDTPGHVDFSAETERTLQVLDYAVLLISGADGVQGHTKTLWGLLKKYRIPVFLFINKMDQPGTDREALMRECREKLGTECVDFTGQNTESFRENVAVCEEELLAAYLETGVVGDDDIVRLIRQRKLFPCFFGSALRMEGVEELIEGISRYTCGKAASEAEEPFGARVYKISRDEQGNRLTFLKVTSGRLRPKDVVNSSEEGGSLGIWQEKVNQIRLYSGEKYDAVDEAVSGGIYAVTGLSKTHPGEGLGIETASPLPVLEPVLTYQVILPEDCQPPVFLPKLRLLEEEDPQLHILWDEKSQEIRIQVMGQVQLEILQSMVEERFHVCVGFGAGSIVYKETIAAPVEGVGHFEPLRHYAEVHLLLEPGDRGSGLQVAADCSVDELALNWQRLILTHLEEKEFTGVLTNSVITDMKITLKAGKAHLKHTEGGDFRQATYRALRQGLMQAESVLLEPWYEFTLEVPEQSVGRAMTDLERLGGKITAPELQNGVAILKGQAPVACLQEYQSELTAYSKGQGSLSCIPAGYLPCHNTEEVLGRIGYDAERDLENPSSSVFCAHGAGFIVPWYQVPEYMHLESIMKSYRTDALMDLSAGLSGIRKQAAARPEELSIGTDEIDAIIARTSHANSQGRTGSRKWNSYGKKGENAGTRMIEAAERTQAGLPGKAGSGKQKQSDKEYLLVDGYNIIFAWQDLQELAEVNIDSARGKLLDILCNYQGIRGCELIVVFDAYRVKGHDTEISDYHNIHVVYTKEAETADQYIEKFAHENGRKYRVTVATSDGLEQVIIRGQGCGLLSAREFQKEVAQANSRFRSDYLAGQGGNRNYMLEGLDAETRKQIEDYRDGYEKQI